MKELTKGANAPIDRDRLRVTLNYTGGQELDIAALLCGSDGKVRSDDDFVFYNQPRHRSQAVAHERPTGSGNQRDFLDIDLHLVEDAIDTIVISASVHVGDFGQLTNLTASLVDTQSGADLIRFTMLDASVETAMIAGEIYRRNGVWKFRAVGQGYASGLGGVATDYGISIDDSDLQQENVPQEHATPVPVAVYPPALETSAHEAAPASRSTALEPYAPPSIAEVADAEGDIDDDIEVTLQPFPTDNPYIKRIFTMKEFGRAPGRAIAVYRERVIDPEEKMIAAFKSKHGQYRWGYLVLTTMTLRWFQTVPVRDEEVWSWDDVGLNGSVVVCENFQYQLKGFGAGRKFKALMMVLAQAEGWADSRRR